MKTEKILLTNLSAMCVLLTMTSDATASSGGAPCPNGQERHHDRCKRAADSRNEFGYYNSSGNFVEEKSGTTCEQNVVCKCYSGETFIYSSAIKRRAEDLKQIDHYCPANIPSVFDVQLQVISSAQNVWVCNAGITSSSKGNILFFTKKTGPNSSENGSLFGSAAVQSVFGSNENSDRENYSYFTPARRPDIPVSSGTSSPQDAAWQDVIHLTSANTSLTYGNHIFVDVCAMSPFSSANGADVQFSNYQWTLSPTITYADLSDPEDNPTESTISTYADRAKLKWAVEYLCSGNSSDETPALNLTQPILMNSGARGDYFLNESPIIGNVNSVTGSVTKLLTEAKRCVFRYHLKESAIHVGRIKSETEKALWTLKLDTHIAQTP